MQTLLEKLNLEQKQAVEHTNGPLLIVAGAGTGKTFVLTTKIAHLIEQELAKPDEILALTFTDKAAGEMEERIDKMLPYGYVDLWVSTFHSFCQKILENHGIEIGLPEFKLLSETQQWILVRENLDKFNLDYYRPLGNPTKFIKSMLKHFSRAKDEMITPEKYLEYAQNLKLNGDSAELIEEEKKKIEEIANAYHIYNQLLLDEGALDFGDLINYTYKLFTKRPTILKKYQEKFKYILVDEFQDTNYAQYELVKLLAKPKNNLIVVGDDDQSIYAFRGASMSNILKFSEDYPDAKKVVLTKNYRTGQNILDFSYNFICQNNPNRLETQLDNLCKKLDSQTGKKGSVEMLQKNTLEMEVASIMEKILEIKSQDTGATFNDFAILVRSNESAKPFIHQAEILGMPYLFLASRGLYNKPCVSWIISFIKLLDGYKESSATHNLLLMPVWDISLYQVADLNYHSKKKSLSLYEVCEKIEIFTKDDELIKKIKHIVNFINDLREYSRNKKPSLVVLRFLNESGLITHINNLSSEAEKKQSFDYLNKFFKKVQNFEKDDEGATINSFLKELEFEMESGDLGALPIDTSDGPEMIKIMTVHSSKGLEFKYVFIANLVDRRFPSSERKEAIELPKELIKELLPEGDIHLEEERRLFYVASTRAKEKLFLTWAYDYGGARPKKPSRFLYETDFVKTEEAVKKCDERPVGTAKRLSAQEQKSIEHQSCSIPKHFSYSQIKAYDTCPYQYKMRHILNIPTEAKFQASFGRSVHNTLEKFFLLIKQSKNKTQEGLFGESRNNNDIFPPIEKLEEIYNNEWIDDWYESKADMEKHKKEGLNALRKYYKILKDNPPKPLALEQDFTLKFNNNPFKGKIDRIDENSNKTISVVDYKTGSLPKKEKLSFKEKEQLLIYYLACKEVLKLEPKKLSLYFIKENKSFEFEAEERDLQKVKENIENTIKQIKSYSFDPKPSEINCKFCDYRDICEFKK